MPVNEVDLPGVGKRFEIELDDDDLLIVVIHYTGKREVFLQEGPDDDPEKLLDLDATSSQLIGSVLDGSYFEPEREEQIEAILNEGVVIEWFDVDPASKFAGKTLGESDFRQETGVSIVAIQREGETKANPSPETVLRPSDTVIGIGSRDACISLKNLLDPGE